MNTLPILVKPYIREYFLHKQNLGPEPIIERRHWLGRLISSIISFHPLDTNELPDDYRLPSNIAKLVTLNVEVTFPIKIHQIDMHHMLQMGNALESMFEQHLSFYAKGYFSYVVNYQGAVNKFFTEYAISEELISKEAAYKVVERDYKIEKDKKDALIKTFVGF